jgi:phosphoglycerate dehydrogenase-like enzyme
VARSRDLAGRPGLPADALTRVAFLDDYQGAVERFVHEIEGAEFEVFHNHLADEDAVVERLAGFDVVVAMRERTPFPRSVLERLPELRLLITTGSRNASIDLDAATEHGVLVCGTGNVDHLTAELALGLMLALARRIVHENAALRRGEWQTELGITLRGKRLGLVGLGRLGGTLAPMAQALGMEVAAWSENLTPERAAQVGVEFVASLDELLASADVVSIHTRLSDRTRGLISRERIAVMKRDAFLVNTSRGPIVDTVALVEALKSGAIAGAAIDVFDEEPLAADDPLRSAPNTVLTPHIGYVSAENYELYFRDAVEDIEAFLAGRPVRCLNAP